MCCVTVSGEVQELAGRGAGLSTEISTGTGGRKEGNDYYGILVLAF